MTTAVKQKQCINCKGDGFLIRVILWEGRDRVAKYTCPVCKGAGKVETERNHKMRSEDNYFYYLL